MAKFDYNDDSVVVIVGSGAGGGTLANELCQKGVKVVVLEAGKRQSSATFINDAWKSFGQLAWTDKRTTSGNWRVAKDVDAKAADPKTIDVIKSGVAKLNNAASGKWNDTASLSDAQRTAIVEANQTDPFVLLVRGQCVTSLYNNEMAFAHFGYEGEAFSKGGYVYRGFNDLTWLPNPPADASPPVA